MENLITTYFSKLKDVPDDYNKMIITRYPPKWLEIDRSKKMYLLQIFSPTSDILMNYKKDGDWDKYVKDFSHYINYNAEFKRVARLMCDNIKNRDSKYALVCFEKDGLHCHRQLVAKWMKEKCDIEWEEM